MPASKLCRSSRRWLCCVQWLVVCLSFASTPVLADDAPPSGPSAEQVASTARQLKIARLNQAIEQQPAQLNLYSQRGDACFFEGDFEQAFADYDKMSQLDPKLVPFNWRRGLALHYLARHKEAAEQFAKYYEFDQSDRENGIWRYYSQLKELGEEQARAALLNYEKPDRPPLPEVYKLCAGEVEPAVIVAMISADDLTGAAFEQRQFYGQLYLGMHYVVHDEFAKARPHLEQAVASEWAQSAGYGPNYMWHVARLQLGLLSKQPAEPPPATNDDR
ncbi:MAG: hypothetical protein R3B90_02005 [Planctomycetaceae bacterium]